MPTVFISYKTPDLASAERICSSLESQGIACWMAPRDIPPGSDWPSAVMHGIKGAKVMVLVLSAASHSDKQIAREVQNADHEGLSIITLRLDDVSPPDELAYFLRNLQWLDAFDGRFDSALKQLAAVVVTAPAQAATPTAARTGTPKPVGSKTASSNRLTLIWSAIGAAAVAVVVWAMLHNSPLPPRPSPQKAAVSQATMPGGTVNAQTASAPISLAGESNADVANSQPPVGSVNKAESVELRNAARREWRNGKQAKAINDISHLITIEPKWAAPYLDRGEWELARGQNKEALADFKTCIDAHPDSLATEQICYQHRGEMEQTMGSAAAASADLAEAASIKAKMKAPKGK